MAGLRKIDNVMYRVCDLESAARFYEDVLGLRRLWEDSKAGQVGLVFPESDAEIVLHTDPDIPNPDVSFLVDDVHAYCRDFAAQGYQVVRDPFRVRCGWLALLADLDGNTLAILDLTALPNERLRDPVSFGD